jgi:hypothetical protein
MNKLFVFFIFSFFSFEHYYCQTKDLTIDEWKASQGITPTEYREFISPSFDSKKDLDLLIKSKKDFAKTELIKILQNNLNNEFSYLIDLNNLEQYYVEQDKKSFRIICVINKKALSDFWTKELRRRYQNLKYTLSESQIETNLKSSQISSMLKSSMKTLEELKYLEDVLSRIDSDVDLLEINGFKSDINANINKLNNSLDKSVVNDKIKQANLKLTNKKYFEAYMAFKSLALDFPDNLDISNSVEDCKKLSIKYYENKLLKYEAEESYSLALNIIDSISLIDANLTEKYSDKAIEYRKFEFLKIESKIEKLLSYKSVSAEQLRPLITELRSFKEVDSKKFESLYSKAEVKLIDYDFKIIRSDVYNKRYSEALSKIPSLKYNYSRNKKIDKLENYVEKKMFTNFKKELLSTRPRRFNIEVSLLSLSPIILVDQFENYSFTNLSMEYGLGIYKRLGTKKKSGNHYAYSVIGLKYNYLDAQNSFNEDNSQNITLFSYHNPQISFGYRKTLYFDIGVISSNFNDLLTPQVFQGGFSFYLPMSLVSIGINSKVVTDFKSNSRYQIGAGIKLNLGFNKKFNRLDKEELNTKILKFK